jgi:hypothetical protein
MPELVHKEDNQILVTQPVRSTCADGSRSDRDGATTGRVGVRLRGALDVEVNVAGRHRAAGHERDS